MRSVLLAAVWCAIGLALAACPTPYSVELEAVEPTPSLEPEFVTLRYLGSGPVVPDCVGGEISELRADIEIVDGKAFWHAAFPQPVPSSSLKRFFDDPALRQRLAPYNLNYLITVSSHSASRDPGRFPAPLASAEWQLRIFEVEAELWRWDEGSFITQAGAEGSGTEAFGKVLVVPLFYEPFGMRSATCEAVAQEIAKAIEPRAGPIRAVVLGAGDSGVVPAVRMDGWPVMDLAAKAKDPGSQSFYRLATHLKVDSELHGDWIAETQYRVGTTPGGYAQTGFVTPERWIWLCRAAHRDHARAQLKMGDRYRDGTDPVSPDPVKSYMWHVLAAANGSDDGAKRVANHRTQLTPDQLGEGEQLVRAWRPDPAKCDIEAAAWRAENRLSSRDRSHTDSSN